MPDGELGEDLGRVVARRPLAVAAGEAEDEVALLVAHALGRAVEPLLGEEDVVGELVGAIDRNHPRAVVGVAVLVDLEERLGREEPAVRHQALVDRPELVDAERRVRDGLPALPGLLAREAEVRDDLLEHLVGQMRAIDERTCSRHRRALNAAGKT